MRKLRIIPWLLGIALIVTTVAGANHFLHRDDVVPGNGGNGGGGAAPAAAAKAPAGSHDGLIAKGTVRSDPPIVAYTLPAHLQAGTIAQVPVFGGKKVEVGETLIVFASDLLQKDLEAAKAAQQTAFYQWKMAETEIPKVNNAKPKAEIAVTEAKQKQDYAHKALAAAESQIKTYQDTYRNPANTPATPEQIAKFRKESKELLDANAKIDAAANAVSAAEQDLANIQSEIASVTAKVKVAEINAKALETNVAKAQQAIDDCTIKAKSAGVIEQVTASPGQTVYPGTRPPLFYLVPSGKRIVWAEIVPDFAHKIKDRVGQKVVISDDSNTSLTYDGVVKRISDSFLQKPNGQPDIINGKSNEVLIVEVEVLDATPAGKPPLRVGQPVRVTFP